MSKGLKTLLGGIVITVIGGLIIWYLTNPGSVLNPSTKPSVEKTPIADVKIIDFNIYNTFVDHTAPAIFKVYNNSGKIVAEECEILWFSGTKVGKELHEIGGYGSEYSRSIRFSLKPKETRDIKMQSLVYTEAGRILSRVEVSVQIPGQQITTGRYLKDVIVRRNP
jgi:hypothetical protein